MKLTAHRIKSLLMAEDVARELRYQIANGRGGITDGPLLAALVTRWLQHAPKAVVYTRPKRPRKVLPT